MNSFKIGNTEFGIGDIQLSIEQGILNLEIAGNEEIFNELTEEDDSEWAWALEAPQIYFRGVPYEGKKVLVVEDTLNQYEIALYMMEYNDFTGMLELNDKNIQIFG